MSHYYAPGKIASLEVANVYEAKTLQLMQKVPSNRTENVWTSSTRKNSMTCVE